MRVWGLDLRTGHWMASALRIGKLWRGAGDNKAPGKASTTFLSRTCRSCFAGRQGALHPLSSPVLYPLLLVGFKCTRAVVALWFTRSPDPWCDFLTTEMISHMLISRRYVWTLHGLNWPCKLILSCAPGNWKKKVWCEKAQMELVLLLNGKQDDNSWVLAF